MLDRMVELQKLWDDALVDAAKTKAAKENAADHGGVQHSDCQSLGGLGRDFRESVSASKRRKISAV